jgi:crotonobetainyl-CoA hydratase
MADLVSATTRGRVLEIVFTRPPVNAFSLQMDWDMYRAFRKLHDDPDLLVGLLRSGCEIFSAGMDLKETAETQDQQALIEEGGLAPGGMGGLVEFWELKKPVVTAVNGHAVGGGFEMILASDVIVAAEDAEFWLPEMERGFLADAGAVQRLGRCLPYHVAMDLMLTGRHMTAAEAKHWGLVNEVVPLSRLLDRAREIADRISEQSPLALQALKEVFPTMSAMSVRDAFQITRAATRAKGSGETGFPWYERMMASSDYLEGSKAFVEKRKPRWRDFGSDLLSRETDSLKQQEARAEADRTAMWRARNTQS